MWSDCKPARLRPQSGTPHYQFHVHWISALIDLHFQTLLETGLRQSNHWNVRVLVASTSLRRMTSGRTTPRTGSQLDLRSTDVAALCLQLLVELSQRHAGGPG